MNCKRILKTIYPTIIISLLIISTGYSYELYFLRNNEFNSDLKDWQVCYLYETDYGPVSPGVVSWTSSHSGSCSLYVSGAPGFISIIQMTQTTIYPGDTLIANIPHTNMSGYGQVDFIVGFELNDQFGQHMSRNDGNPNFEIVANKIYPPGYPIRVRLVVWPGSGTAWINYIRLKRAGTTIGISEENYNSDIPTHKTNLLQKVTPNPFYAVSKLEYNVPYDAPVAVRVFDALGRLTRTLVNESKPKGSYNVIWDGTDDNKQKVSPGNYYYVVEFDKKVATKKTVVLR